MSRQSFFNNVCNSLRTYGNQYGSRYDRKWSWINPNNSDERCAIARIYSKATDYMDVIRCVQKEIGTSDFVTTSRDSLVRDIIMLFDYAPASCNNSIDLEQVLAHFADKHNLTLPATVSVLSTVSVNEECTV